MFNFSRTSRTGVLRTMLLAATAALTNVASASLPPTQAWSQTFSIGTSDQFAGPRVACDASGYCYFAYVSFQPTGNVLHLVKMGPAKNVAFDHIVDTFQGYALPFGVMISPMIAGKQYVYVAAHFAGAKGLQVYLHKFDTAAVQQWASPYQGFASDTSGSVSLYDAYPNAAGHLFVALNQDEILRFADLDETGLLVHDNRILDTDPKSANFYPHANAWLATGRNLASTYPNSGRWGLYDPITSAHPTSQAINGDIEYHLWPLPTGNFVWMFNVFNHTNGNRTSASSYAEIDTATNLTDWSSTGWRTAQSLNGEIMQVATFSANGPVYIVSHANLNDLTSSLAVYPSASTYPNVTPLYTRVNQPIDRLFPTVEGFFSEWYQYSSNAVFLEHFNNVSATYDFGKAYKGTGTAANSFAGMAFFQNFSYVIFNINNTGTGADVVVDRYVTGVCMQKISCANTTKSGQSLAVLVNLNDVAPTAGVTVGLNSSSSKLLMPNGTRAQNFTVPAGASYLVVQLNAQPVTGNTSVTLLAIQNGIRRGAATTITP